ncbi:hypothetical protein HYQ44_014423 [Verticillium longisporum]|nr:hypothetical protein HYQ44_014423 [Verticillium longisporum]
MVHHVKRTHGREQDLKCPGCDARFARAGGLMGHLEYEECSAIPKSALDAYRTKKLAMPLALEKLSLTESDSDKADSIAGNAHDWVRHPAENQAPANRLSFAPDAFPILPNQASQVPQPQDQRQQPGGKDLTDAWGRQENLFPNATAVQRPTSEQLAEATRPNAKSEYLAAIHDPNHQDFDAEKYFNDFNNLFECPMKGCPQSFDSAVAITNHLVTRGMHGTGDRLQCPACLRFFVGVTAMTQHAESQSTRCNIRTSAKYRPFLAQLTAGVMDAALERARSRLERIALPSHWHQENMKVMSLLATKINTLSKLREVRSTRIENLVHGTRRSPLQGRYDYLALSMGSALLWLLRMFRNRRSSEPRDKVIALLQLRQDLGSFLNDSISPDYACTVHHLFTHVSFTIMRTTGIFWVTTGDLLSKSRHDIPSWVPDWSNDTTAYDPHHLSWKLPILFSAGEAAYLTDEKNKTTTQEHCRVLLQHTRFAPVLSKPWRLALAWLRFEDAAPEERPP